MSSVNVLKAYPAKYPNYKCFMCHKVIDTGTLQVWDKTRAKMDQNGHESCYRNNGSVSNDTPQNLQKNSEAGTSKVIDEVLDYCETHMELANEVRIKVQALADEHKYFADANDKKQLLGFTSHDIIMAKLTADVVGSRIAEKNVSVEIDEVANSSQIRGASQRSFHTSSTIKDTVDEWHEQSLEIFAQPLFFIIRNKRFVPKCEIHGTVCNEETFECKKCTEYRDKQKHMQDLFSPNSMIDRSLLL